MIDNYKVYFNQKVQKLKKIQKIQKINLSSNAFVHIKKERLQSSVKTYINNTLYKQYIQIKHSVFNGGQKYLYTTLLFAYWPLEGSIGSLWPL